jgi:hypothetical protein
MKNSASLSKHWIDFIANRPEFRAGPELRAAFEMSRVTRLCECGCNSFDVESITGGSRPIASPSETGKIAFLMELPTCRPDGLAEFMVYVNSHGQFTGMDVHFNGNCDPMPEVLVFEQPPIHLHGELVA